ncbi:hypothetical protein ANO11243_076540 [Dothideomycetidae sp. 11243]|nr:hypothetical protein ANO11243_076540 [fungal sp. No.11243]
MFFPTHGFILALLFSGNASALKCRFQVLYSQGADTWAKLKEGNVNESGVDRLIALMYIDSNGKYSGTRMDYGVIIKNNQLVHGEPAAAEASNEMVTIARRILNMGHNLPDVQLSVTVHCLVACVVASISKQILKTLITRNRWSLRSNFKTDPMAIVQATNMEDTVANLNRLSQKPGVRATLVLSRSKGDIVQSSGLESHRDEHDLEASVVDEDDQNRPVKLASVEDVARLVFEHVKTSADMARSLNGTKDDELKLMRIRTKRNELVIVPGTKSSSLECSCN